MTVFVFQQFCSNPMCVCVCVCEVNTNKGEVFTLLTENSRAEQKS